MRRRRRRKTGLIENGDDDDNDEINYDDVYANCNEDDASILTISCPARMAESQMMGRTPFYSPLHSMVSELTLKTKANLTLESKLS